MNKDTKKPKVLYFDIENSPIISYNWGIWEQNAIAVKQDWFMLSFAYCWGDGPVRTHSLREFATYSKDKTNDKELTKKLWELLDEADVVIAHNGDRFDIKKANARFLFHKLKPPSPYKTIDTLKVARRYFNLTGNRLNDLAKYLGVGKKVDTGGFDLWLGCLAGDAKAWRKMELYNKVDVHLCRDVYKALRPWITNHPNFNVYQGTSHSCPSCGGKKTQARGFNITKVGKRQRYCCQSCGAWSQGELIKTDTVLR